MPTLTYNSYGKSRVRLTKVVRKTAVHELFEIDAAVQLRGAFEASYTQGDNRDVVATDTIKNTVYVVAKEHDFKSIEEFAVLLASHFVKTYPQVAHATVELTQTAWRRIPVAGKPHDFAFTSGGPQLRLAIAALARGGNVELVGGVRDLVVLKTTDSEWRDFHRDRYRTLKDTSDRILATKVNAEWTYTTAATDFNAANEQITTAVLETFATKHSLGAQQSIWDMGEAALSACAEISKITFALPNLHRIPFNLEPFGLKFENDIFIATDEPHGLITGTIERK